MISPAEILIVFISPFIGSFLGVLIRRLPSGEAFAAGRSHCDSCGTALAPADLIPIFSYIYLRGYCRKCGIRIGEFHLYIELLSLVIALISITFLTDLYAWIAAIFGWWLLTASWIDIEHYELPDALTLPLIPIGIGFVYLVDRERIWSSVLGSVIGYAAFRLIAYAYRRFRGFDGLGEGDARLLAGSGAWLGWAGLPHVVLLAALGGLIFAGIMRLAGKPIRGMTMIPFGPFLALATWLLWIGANAFWWG